MKMYSKAAYDRFSYQLYWKLLDHPYGFEPHMANTFIWDDNCIMPAKNNVGFRAKDQLHFNPHFTTQKARIIPSRRPIIWDRNFFDEEIFGNDILAGITQTYDFALPSPPKLDQDRLSFNRKVSSIISLTETVPFFTILRQRSQNRSNESLYVHCMTEADGVLVSAWMCP